ncbi:hypothetical protein [Gracilibacillus xinjiangensis]|uniref:Transmembrane protein n=1 Tax=Gracilibacillus xinjiangensis TaxID=1193282 RepID=A0ABV8WZD3_9BACI
MKSDLDDQASSLRDLVNKRDDKNNYDDMRLPTRRKMHQKKRKRDTRKKIELISVLLFLFLFIVAVFLLFPIWGAFIFSS